MGRQPSETILDWRGATARTSGIRTCDRGSARVMPSKPTSIGAHSGQHGLAAMLQVQPLSRERWLILVLLLGLATAAWWALFARASMADFTMGGPTMGMSAPLFLA